MLLDLILLFVTLSWNPPDFYEENLSIIPYQEGFAFITNDSIYYSINGKITSKRSHNFEVDMYRMVDISDVRRVSDRVYLMAAGGGIVYKFEKDTLFRVDQSYRWMTRFGDATKSIGDSIISFGGYGEYRYNNNLVFFSEDYKEWGLIPINPPKPPDLVDALIQYDTIKNSVYVGLGTSNYFQNRLEFSEVQIGLFRINMSQFQYEPIGSFKSIIGVLKEQGFHENYRTFNKFDLPMLYGKFGIWTFDLMKLKAFYHKNADLFRLTQYDEIVTYNKSANKFLLVKERRTKNAIYHTVNASELLGLGYDEYSLEQNEFPNWVYFLFGGFALLLFPLFRKRTLVGLDQAILKEERKIQQQLSSEDFFILKRIVEAFPEYVEYPELQNSYEKDLSYESRIKKLRASIKEIDEVVQKTIGRKRSSIFEIEKGREDKRVKVIRIKDDNLKKTDFFGRLRRSSK